MPQVFKIGPYWVYFWSNEGRPLEPIHVHVAEGSPAPNATKIWITRSGKCYLCIEARSMEVLEKWNAYFGETTFFC